MVAKSKCNQKRLRNQNATKRGCKKKNCNKNDVVKAVIKIS